MFFLNDNQLRPIIYGPFLTSDPADKEAMDEAERHALQVIPEGSSLSTFFVYALIPESIRFALNMTVYARYKLFRH